MITLCNVIYWIKEQSCSILLHYRQNWEFRNVLHYSLNYQLPYELFDRHPAAHWLQVFYTHTVMYTAPNLLCSIILGTNTPSVFSLNVLLFHDMKNCVKNIFFYFLNWIHFKLEKTHKIRVAHTLLHYELWLKSEWKKGPWATELKARKQKL